MKYLALFILTLNACVVDNRPKKYSVDISDFHPVCEVSCSKYNGIDNIDLKIITGSPTVFTIGCKCVGKYYMEWIKNVK